MQVSIRWIRYFLSMTLFVFFIIAAKNRNLFIYLVYQAKGQMTLLLKREPLGDFTRRIPLSPEEQQNLQLVERIKKYSVDSLGYEPTGNFTRIYDQQGQSILWVVTACEPFAFEPYVWKFPLVGKVTYKGFFKKEMAQKEYNHLVVLGYDADIRPVSAWSTLGWFEDPLLSSMLNRSKGSLCNLLFHELFHATYYAPNSVDFNENVASFVAHEATLRFLRKDTSALKDYERRYCDNKIYTNYMLRKLKYLKTYYDSICRLPDRNILKLKAIYEVQDSIKHLPLHNKGLYLQRLDEALRFKNAWFVDFIQYNSMQDSLEDVFNKIYKGNIEKMVQDLKLN